MKTHSTSYPDRTREISSTLGELRRDQSCALHAFDQLSRAAMAPGALSARAKELIALALGVVGHCEGCIAFHARALVALEATTAEIEEALAVAVYMGGATALMHSAGALVAVEQFRREAAGAARST